MSKMNGSSSIDFHLRGWRQAQNLAWERIEEIRQRHSLQAFRLARCAALGISIEQYRENLAAWCYLRELAESIKNSDKTSADRSALRDEMTKTKMERISRAAECEATRQIDNSLRDCFGEPLALVDR